MIAKEMDGMGPYKIVTDTPPLPMDAGDMIVSRIDLKKMYRSPEATTKPNPCWHEIDPRTTDAAVELLGLMWKERGMNKSDNSGDEE